MEGKELSKISVKKLLKRIEAMLGSSSVFKPKKSWLARFSLLAIPQQVSPECPKRITVTKDGLEISKAFADEDSQVGKVKKKPAEEVIVKTLPKLPDELVEKIMARVPFPFIFKSRVLSKSWLARLSSISSQEDEQKKHLAISFQKQMLECSPYWKTFSSECTSDSEFPNYDCTKDALEGMSSLSFLPKNLLNKLLPKLQGTKTEGAILLIRSPVRRRLHLPRGLKGLPNLCYDIVEQLNPQVLYRSSHDACHAHEPVDIYMKQQSQWQRPLQLIFSAVINIRSVESDKHELYSMFASVGKEVISGVCQCLLEYLGPGLLQIPSTSGAIAPASPQTASESRNRRSIQLIPLHLTLHGFPAELMRADAAPNVIFGFSAYIW